MLPERYARLISAYVDGELPAHQHKMARRLLRRSRRARALYEQLRVNAERLQALPRQSLGAEFVPQVMQTIAALPAAAATPAATPTALPASLKAQPWLTPNLLGIAAAASILLAVAVAAYLLFDPQRPGQTVQARSEEDKLLPARQIESIVLPGTRLALSDPHLDKQLARSNAIHLEISCPHNAHAVAELKDAFKDNGVRVLIDPAADLSSGDFVVYAENLNVQELVDVLRQQRQFDAVFLNPVTELDRRTVAGRLGVGPEAFKAPGPATIELKKMIPKTGNPNQVLPTSPPVERFAVVLAASPSRGLSQELKEFVATRRQQPGTIQVVLVLHEVRA